MAISHPVERSELQRLLSQLEPVQLDYLERFIDLIRSDDARLLALIEAREAGLLSDCDYYEQANQLCMHSGQSDLFN